MKILMNQHPNSICEHCEERPEELLCTDCDDKFCSECFVQQHSSKKKQNHHQVELNEKYFSMFCEFHPTEKIEFYCFDHKNKLCKICYEKEHKTHFSEPIDKIIKKFQQESQILSYSKEEIQNQKKKFLNFYNEEQKEVYQKFNKTKDKMQLKFDIFKSKKEKIEKDFSEYHEIMNKIESGNELSFDEILEIKSCLNLQCWELPTIQHIGISCDQCKTKNFTGIRWKCNECPNFDLCDICIILKGIHPKHGFTKIEKPVEVDPKIHSGVQCNKCGMKNFIGYRYFCRTCKNVNLCNSCFEDKLYLRGNHDSHIFIRISDANLPKHLKVICGHCQLKDFNGKKYTCKQCEDYDLCEYCFENRSTFHQKNHIFKVYSYPQTEEEMLKSKKRKEMHTQSKPPQKKSDDQFCAQQ
eukprot:gene4065-7354_t